MNHPKQKNDPVMPPEGNGYPKDFDQRLRGVEVSVAEIKTTLEHKATSKDVSDLENKLLKWMFGTILAVMIATATVIITVLK